MTSMFRVSVPPRGEATPQFPLDERKKVKEEQDLAAVKLVDQRFDIRIYPDPLLPRMVPKESDKAEARLQEVIDKTKAKMARKLQ